jgi:propionyl-CoA synthetase
MMNDNYGLTEQGVPLSTHDLNPSCSLDASHTKYTPGEALKVVPGCAGKAMPGMDLHVVDDAGNDVPPGTMGNVVLGLPLSPSSFSTLYKDEERFYTSYLKRFSGRWFDTGDAGMFTEEGYAIIMSRADDVINVAAHRLSTGENHKMLVVKQANTMPGAIEEAISSHPAVAECCVIGIPDEMKGSLPFAFVVTYSPQDETKLFADIQKEVRSQQGSIASLGGMISAKQGENLIPKTRSGKMLRRNLREIVENVLNGEIEKEVQIPAVRTLDKACVSCVILTELLSRPSKILPPSMSQGNESRNTSTSKVLPLKLSSDVARLLLMRLLQTSTSYHACSILAHTLSFLPFPTRTTRTCCRVGETDQC